MYLHHLGYIRSFIYIQTCTYVYTRNRVGEQERTLSCLAAEPRLRARLDLKLASRKEASASEGVRSKSDGVRSKVDGSKFEVPRFDALL